MKNRKLALAFFSIGLLFFFPLLASNFAEGLVHLEVVAEFADRQPTGIAVSKEGRMFVNFPHWDEFHNLSVAELLTEKDGKKRLQPYPLEWDQDGPGSAAAGTPSTNAFYCVQSVFCDDKETLWILDSGAPGMKDVVDGQAKLVSVDLTTNKSTKVIVFNKDAAPPKSYLNDVRVDTARRVAYVTDSGLGAILVVDLEKGDVRRVLDHHPSTQPEPDFALNIFGKPLLDTNGKPPQIAADGIELVGNGNFLYYHALSGRALYRIETEALRDPKLPADQLAQRVVRVADTGPVDGLGVDSAGFLYLSCLEDGTIRRLSTTTLGAQLETVIQDPRIMWPDSFAVAPDGSVYFSCSQLENSARFNQGQSVRTTPYQIFKIAY